MKKGLGMSIIFGIISLMIISNVIAYQSTITVKTGLPNQDIIFRACDQVDGKTLPGGEFRAKSDSYGEVVFDYNLESVLIKMSFMAWNGNGYSTFLNGKEAVFISNVILDELVDVNLNQVNASVNAYSNKTKEEPTAVEDNNSGIDVQVEVSNNTANNTITENETEDIANNQIKEEKSSSLLTGAVIDNGKAIFTSKTTYYVLGGLFLLGIVGFFMLSFRRGNLAQETIKVTKYSDMQKNKEGTIEEDSAIAEAERKLEEAKREIEDIKNKKSKIQEAKKRLEDAKRELDELGEY